MAYTRRAANRHALACRADDCKVDMLYGPEIVGRLHDLAKLIAGPDINQIYNCDFD